MLKIVLATFAVALMPLLTASEVHAYGAAHVGYTHVGPNGVQHYGATERTVPAARTAAATTAAMVPAGLFITARPLPHTAERITLRKVTTIRQATAAAPLTVEHTTTTIIAKTCVSELGEPGA